MRSECVKLIPRLYDRLEELLINPAKITEASSPKSILSALTNLSLDFPDQKLLPHENLIGVGETRLVKHLELLEVNAFVELISQECLEENNDLLRSLSSTLITEKIFSLGDEMPQKLRQTIFFRLLDRLSASKRMSAFLAHQYNEEGHRVLRNTCGSLLIVFLNFLLILNVNLLGKRLENYRVTLLIPLITFLDTHFLSNAPPSDDLLISGILRFLNFLTESTITIPIFIAADLPQQSLRWLVLPSLTRTYYQSIMRLIYHIASHDDGGRVLNQCQCGKAFVQFKREIRDGKIDFILDASACRASVVRQNMIYLLLIDYNQLAATDEDNFIVRILIPQTVMVAQSLGLTKHEYNLSELLPILAKICISEKEVSRIFRQDRSPHFYSTVLYFYSIHLESEGVEERHLDSHILIVLALVNILWSVSFHDRYRDQVRAAFGSVQKLEKFYLFDLVENVLPTVYIPRHLTSFRRAMDGIWENLNPSTPLTLSPRPSTTSLCSLMISYSHADMAVTQTLANALSKVPQLSIHLDVNSCKYSWKDTAQTIEQSDVVLLLLSEDYCRSKSCRQELIYAVDRLRKPVIPLSIDSND